MKDYGFIAFLFDTMLREVFVTKVNMAAQLGVNHRTLQINFQRLNYRKGGTVACENLFLYCLEHGYSL
ncbi:MAG: hypothetical protein IJ100_12205, partial [Lachnospiraceae bacterium]|nr:hypothetical protein [Lachnospiraceae bacterium]